MEKPITWKDVVSEIADELLHGFEVSAEWPDFSSFRDICGDFSVNPTPSLFVEAKGVAIGRWESLKASTKSSIELSN